MAKTSLDLNTTIIPMSNRVLIRKDEDKGITSGGLILPDSVKIPVITARVVALASDIDPLCELRQYDKVLVNPHRVIPIDFESGNKLYIVPFEDVVAIFRKKQADQEDDSGNNAREDT